MQFWFGRVNYEVKTPRPSDLSLDRMRTLMRLLGDPHERLRIVHVAGTKGKGSTSAMLAAVLGCAGFRTGLFTSPHLVRVEERIQVDAQPIGPEELGRLMADIRDVVERGNLNHDLTFFEIATALGFLHFSRRRVEFAVMEVGLGGRFDSTNVCRPLLSIITSISFDHTRQLGNTLASIANEKSGIVKPGRPALSGARASEALEVIVRICRERDAPLRQIDADFSYRHDPARIGEGADVPTRVQATTWRGVWPWLDLGLIGEHQAANAALAIAAVESLRAQGVSIPMSAVAQGLASVKWPARLEIIGRHPLVVLDCAHNVASVQALVQALDTSFPLRPGGRSFLIFAGSRDKDLIGMLRLLAPKFERILFTPYTVNPRAVPPSELVDMMPAEDRERAILCTSPAQAWSQANDLAGADDLICVSGSLFLAGEMKALVGVRHG
ncbi:MAG: bifunctional folylpolyglutamate synthase/dihydrofolate synthase [Planctomycetes bacterium]|nr:bifunctional folylpolyglutamate synthase/dihydrofolate synthase [Planctomycetota bacterium]